MHVPTFTLKAPSVYRIRSQNLIEIPADPIILDGVGLFHTNQAQSTLRIAHYAKYACLAHVERP
jgi:hypothetical protein